MRGEFVHTYSLFSTDFHQIAIGMIEELEGRKLERASCGGAGIEESSAATSGK